MEKLNKVSLCAGVLVSLLTICAAVDTIAANQTLKDGDTIVSAGDNFELGFFSPNNSNNRYLGIWYKRISTGTIVWVSNKENPIRNTSGVFKLSSDGRLLVLSGGDTVIWESKSAYSSRVYPVAQLLDTGNLVVRDESSIDQENIIWQSRPSNDICVRYGLCGPYGTCSNNNSPACSCLQGFETKRPQEWFILDWSGGCRRIMSLDCNYGEAFNKISGMKLPDTRLNSWYNVSMTIGECEMACKRNCSCTAYASLDINSGCLAWFGDLEDMRENSGGRDLYVKISASRLTDSQSYKPMNKKVIKVVLSTSVSFLVVCLIVALYTWRKKKRSSILIRKG
ncbi:hypothetical protein L1987_86110 [Smallanthus sonchifolius]|uniref:Uncharacterized protein n=1 Tax=Smallanthus sonchifolius TaxID=185202 RepID=A0ACB8XYD0_9ASTR|nr:hypothetical protein L1987_86110 [Smallanthus sonchifolius]